MNVCITFPNEYGAQSKVPVIKAFRELTGLGLKESKDTVEIPGTIVVNVQMLDREENRPYAEAVIATLRAHGCKIDSATILISGIRKLASDALLLGEDVLADDLMKHLMILKLKHGI